MSGGRHWEQDKEATVYIGNLDERVTDSLVWELMLQAGRIVNVHLPKDRVTQTHQGYGFVEFISEEDAEYAARIMNQVRLYGKPIRVNKASADKQKPVEVGAELFVGNLDPMVDERILYDTFSRFGSLISAPKVARDEANLSKGYGFVSFSNFEASDDAITNMDRQYLMNKEISVQYAYKKDGKGERHGDAAERELARQAQKHNVTPQVSQLPPQLFAAPPVTAPPAMLDGGAGAVSGPPPVAAGFVNGRSPSVPGGFQSVPPPRPPSIPQLPTPPQGLPARPPPSQAGYGGPQGFMPPGFGTPPTAGFQAPQAAPPPMMGAPPAGFAPPPGFAPPMGAPVPPGLPAGFRPPGYGRGG
ncbi:RNA-binding domain-containing protein [Xylona heveae TC161]|uniref:RNA-binding domain-containing protein n=1 Tax=Xylona heveae (strain CBS 132557 / TC161) TaxID=1328760 RepID=A0A165FQZ5_XYLHT|nr:RNA-binding domain-containing protein [Xylona heveae TC161]KZF21272.1 RNA-binding domain-containing protein [Xylona heveae TC161]